MNVIYLFKNEHRVRFAMTRLPEGLRAAAAFPHRAAPPNLRSAPRALSAFGEIEIVETP